MDGGSLVFIGLFVVLVVGLLLAAMVSDTNPKAATVLFITGLSVGASTLLFVLLAYASSSEVIDREAFTVQVIAKPDGSSFSAVVLKDGTTVNICKAGGLFLPDGSKVNKVTTYDKGMGLRFGEVVTYAPVDEPKSEKVKD